MAVEEKNDALPEPDLGRVPAPQHFDTRWSWWAKFLVMLALTVVAIAWLDRPIAAWSLQTRPIPDMSDPQAKHGDFARELMLLEQFGQWVSSVLIVSAVAVLDPQGRRKALAIAIGCLVTVVACHLLKDLCGRTRPGVLEWAAFAPHEPPAGYRWTGVTGWFGPAAGFTKGASYGSFPSAHTTGAFALACGLAWFYPRARAFFMMLALFTAAQRVLHHAHYLSDTIAGVALAVMLTRLTLGANLAGRWIAAMPPPIRAWWMQETPTNPADR